MQYDLVHVAAGDLLRAEISSGSDNGKRAKEYMDIGQLVPDEIVVMVCFLVEHAISFVVLGDQILDFHSFQMVKERLMQPDSQDKGWLLDGYPRSLSQATKLQGYGFHPELFILLEVRFHSFL